VAAGLSAAHTAGIVHRDVKPGNVLIGRDGTAKVSDFGISHAFDDVTVTATGLLVGTPAFLAPEVARGGSPDFASDVYSFGSTLYMAVEGKAPFGGDDNPMAVLHRAASGEWDPPTRSGPLTDLLARMMALDPQARPSVRDVEQQLLRISRGPSATPTAETTQVIPAREHTAVVPPPPPPVDDAAARPADPRRKRSWLPLLIGLLVAALAAVIVVVLLSGNGDDQPGAGQSAGANGPGTITRTGGDQRTSGDQRTTSRSSESSQGESSSAETQPAANPPVGGGSATAQQLADAISEYFQLIPGDLDAGWSRLTPHFQETRAQGRETYDSYWNSVDHVDVNSVQGLPPNSATADLVYYYDDGRVVPQSSTFTLVRQDGILKIDTES
jgi:eukaryotic-like serine/threonine-protein kinase